MLKHLLLSTIFFASRSATIKQETPSKCKNSPLLFVLGTEFFCLFLASAPPFRPMTGQFFGSLSHRPSFTLQFERTT
jgi:hypothetical protein